MLGESESGYLSPFIIYTRAQTDYGNNDDDVLLKSQDDKQPSKVVSSLMKTFLNHGYIMTLCNYYTSQSQQKNFCIYKKIAWIRCVKKKYFQKKLWSWKRTEGDEVMKQYSGKIMVLRWNDVTKTKSTKIVSMLPIDSGRLTGSTKVLSLATNLMLQFVIIKIWVI